MAIKIGGACLNQIPFHWDNNKRNIVDAIQEAKNSGVELLCLPELCITGYGCEDMFMSDWLPESALNVLWDILPNCSNICVSIGLPLLFNEKLYNVVCVVKNTKILGFYAKQILANEGVHYESRWFTPWKPRVGTTIEVKGEFYPIGDICFELGEYKIGFEICEDAWHEERRPGIHHRTRGVNIILNPSASHFAFEKALFREELVQKSSERFDCVYVYTNLLGNESGRTIFDGDIIFAKKGRLIQRNTRLSFRNFNLLSLDVDPKSKHCEGQKRNPDIYEKEEEFTNAVSLALFDYLRKSKSQGFVLSLSGGADSSACAVLVAEMVKRGIAELGIGQFIDRIGVRTLMKTDSPSQVLNKVLTCAYQGTVNSSGDTLRSAKSLANELNAIFFNWNIDDEVNSYTKKVETALNRKLSWEKDDIALQNIQARARSPIIWMFANINNALLLTTSNRSEGDVGYATMDGDTSGSIAPIAGVDKYFIRGWLVWAQHNLGYESLSYVNNLQPSAELRPLQMVQKDEDDLMPYHIMVKIERLAIKEKKSPAFIIESLSNIPEIDKYVSKFFRLWSRNQWKRERVAPSFHLDDFNVDPRSWCRFPILNPGDIQLYQE